MALTSGTRLGPYEITAQIGEGGMGEVYQATDTNLKRSVAIKVLPESVARDPERLARFQREAEVLAALNHPNIAAIYGLEKSDGTTALVMELVEGPTLADRITQGAIPIDDALPIAKQTAEALEAAHEQGIIHRDLKPANIKVRPDGTVKVLDFGLAKALEPTSAMSPGMSQAPTITTSAMTQAGMILGTAAYMSPEQARGEATDSRADIWAFGVVLYELLTGRRLFGAENVSETLAAVLREDPTWEMLPASVPPGVRRLLRRCLQRDRRNRLQHAGDARVEIQDVLSAPTADIAHQTMPSTRWRERVAWALAGVAVLVAVGVAYFAAGQPSSQPVRELSVVPPPGWTFSLVDAPVISPDGSRLAFVGVDANGNTQLWIRDLDAVEPRPIADTEDGRSPFWSPDGLSLAFFANREVRRIDLAGGPVRTLASADELDGGTWSSDGTIVFSPRVGPLLRVTADGGTTTPATQMDTDHGELFHRFPAFLPDGRRFLFVIQSNIPENSGLYIGSLDSNEKTRIGDIRSRAAYADPGYLLFTRNRTLMAQPFDPVALELSGEATVVGGRVASAVNLFGQATFSVSESGVLAYRRVPLLQFTWFDRSGQRLASLGSPGEYSSLSLSPDGQHVAFEQLDPEMHS